MSKKARSGAGAGAGAGAGSGSSTPHANVIARMFADLNQFIVKEEYRKAAKAADRILAELPDDKDALRCKVVCLLNERNYAEALPLCKENPELTFEKSYCLYRLNRLTEAVQVLNTVATKDLRHKHIAAQVNYRSGAFDESIEICNDMISKNEDDSAELLTNTVAAYVSTGKSDKVVKSRLFNPEACPDSYEFAYNYSCALLGRKKYKAAATLLKKAIATCRKIMAEDGAKQSEVDNELAILKTQLAYTCIMAGRRAQAEELCQEVVKSRPSDATVMAVAANNLAVLRAGRDLFDSVKRNKTALAQPVVSKLTPTQRRVMSLNRAILLCYMNRAADAEAAVAELRAEYGSVETIAAISAAIRARQGQTADARATLEAFVTENPTSSALSSAMLAQLAADEGRVADAITAVNASPALAHQPATVAALTSLMDSTGDASGAFDVFHGAAAHWGAVATADGTSTKARTRALGNRAAVLRIGTEFMIKHNMYDKAGSLATMLVEAEDLTPAQGVQANALALLSQARVNLDEAERIASGMTDKVPTLPADVTPEQLADAIMPGFSRTADEATAAAAATSTPHAGAGGNAGAGAAGAASDADNAGSDRAGESDAVAGVEVDGEGEPGDGRQVSAEELAKREKRRQVARARRRAKKKAKRKAAHLAKLLAEGKRTEESVLVAPDPNLWLPRHLRPATGKRGRRRRKLNQSGGGAQGAGDLTASDADALDAAKHADERLAKVNAAKDRNAASAGGPVHRGNKAARKAAKKRNRRR